MPHAKVSRGTYKLERKAVSLLYQTAGEGDVFPEPLFGTEGWQG